MLLLYDEFSGIWFFGHRQIDQVVSDRTGCQKQIAAEAAQQHSAQECKARSPSHRNSVEPQHARPPDYPQTALQQSAALLQRHPHVNGSGATSAHSQPAAHQAGSFCSIGVGTVAGRQLAESHLRACLHAGLKITGGRRALACLPQKSHRQVLSDTDNMFDPPLWKLS